MEFTTEAPNPDSSDISNILKTFRGIKDWNAVKPPPLLPPLSLAERRPSPPPPLKLSPPFYVHVSNLPSFATIVDIYYFFGGYYKIKNVVLYKKGETLRGDGMLHVRNGAALIHILKMDRKLMMNNSLRVRYVDSLMGTFRDIPTHMIDRICVLADSALFNPRNFGIGGSNTDNRDRSARTALKKRATYSRPTISIVDTQAYGRPFSMTPPPPAEKEPTHLLLRRNAVSVKVSLEKTSDSLPLRRQSHNAAGNELKPLSDENSVVTPEMKPLLEAGKTLTFVNSGVKRGGPRKLPADGSPTRLRDGQQRQRLALRAPPTAAAVGTKSAEGRGTERRGSKLLADERSQSKRARRKASSTGAAGDPSNRSTRPTKHNNNNGDKSSEVMKKIEKLIGDTSGGGGQPPVFVEKVKNEEVFCGAKPTNENQQAMNKFFDMLYETTATTTSKKKPPRT